VTFQSCKEAASVGGLFHDPCSPVGTSGTLKERRRKSAAGGKADLMFGYGRLSPNGIAAKAGIRLRSSSRDYADVHGEGSIPVPLPPPPWPKPHILRVSFWAI
jgi:hypothetical protein